MWRAFFFSIGIMLIILGLECLVAESFVVHGARIPGVVAKVLDGTSKSPSAGQFAGSGNSAFGPSRFNNQYQPSGYSQFSLAGYGSQPNGAAPNTASIGASPRVVTPKEWMPWSLLAAGTLVVLYTNSTASGRSGD